MPINATVEQDSIRVSPGRLQLLVVAACCFCAGALYGWSALIPLVESLFTPSTQLAGLIFSTAVVAFTLSVLLVPRLPLSFQDMTGCVLFGALGSITVFLASLCTTYSSFLITFSVGFGASSGAIYINALSVASATNRPAIMTPIMVASFGLGGAVFGPAWRMMIDRQWALNALWPLSAALLGISLIMLFTLTTRPDVRTKSLALDTDPDLGHDHEPMQNHCNRLGASASQVMMLVWLIFACGSAAGLMVLGLASKFIEHAGGLPQVISLTLAGVALGNTTGRLSVSLYSLCVMPINVVLLASLIICTGLVVTWTSTGAVGIAGGLVLVALGYGTMASAIPTLTRSLFPAAQFARRFSVIFTAWGVAGLLSPWIAGMIFDYTNSFADAVLMAFVATLICTLSALWLRFRLNIVH